MSIGWGPDLPGPEMNWLETIVMAVIVAGALVIGLAILIEMETGLPAKVAIEKWMQTL